jgi:hypothetical protein
MGSFLQRRYKHHLRVAEQLHRKGRDRVLWQHGVLYFGGTLFVLYNAIAYFLNPSAPKTFTDFLWIALWFVLCAAAGYLRGLLTWRNLERAFGSQCTLG